MAEITSFHPITHLDDLVLYISYLHKWKIWMAKLIMIKKKSQNKWSLTFLQLMFFLSKARNFTRNMPTLFLHLCIDCCNSSFKYILDVLLLFGGQVQVSNLGLMLFLFLAWKLLAYHSFLDQSCTGLVWLEVFLTAEISWFLLWIMAFISLE